MNLSRLLVCDRLSTQSAVGIAPLRVPRMHRLTRWLTVFSVFSTGCTTKEIHNHYYLSGDTVPRPARGRRSMTRTPGSQTTFRPASAPIRAAPTPVQGRGHRSRRPPRVLRGADPLLVDCDPDVNYDPWDREWR